VKLAGSISVLARAMRQSSELAANAIMAIATNTKVFNKPNLPSFKRKNA
ncbi:MAG: hypothetical protein ACI90R_002465, partial [Alteromonas macleodii]